MIERTTSFREVTVIDFEFAAPPGELPTPLCLVTKNVRTGVVRHYWQDDLFRLRRPPFPIGSDAVVVAFYAIAELSCFLTLGWSLPVNVLDLYVEFRNATNGAFLPCGAGLLGALTYFGIDSIGAGKKRSLQDLAQRGGPYSCEERKNLLAYCESDVVATEKLLNRMEPKIDWPRARLRGNYMAAVARIECHGVPLDTERFHELRANWPAIQDRLIARIDRNYGVYDGRTFKRDRFAAWLTSRDIPWLRLASGELDLKDDTFREMARSYPKVAALRELRVSLSQMRMADLTVGTDGRNRVMLSAFSSKTGRNQPSNKRFIFGPAVWMRGLIRPRPGWSLAYCDWSQQEFGIAAALSGDAAMLAAYRSGDPYLQFAIQARAAPAGATKESHRAVRDQFKACALAVQYGMGAVSLGQRIGQPTIVGDDLLRLHRETYPTFWRWSEAAVNYAMLHCRLHTVFGWTLHIGANVNPRSIANFPMQANGAEMLRLACMFALDRGVRICCPVHDAILIEAPTEEIRDAVRTAEEAMEDASRIVLGGFRLRSEARIFSWPARFMDERGTEMWNTVMQVLAEVAGS